MHVTQVAHPAIRVMPLAMVATNLLPFFFSVRSSEEILRSPREICATIIFSRRDEKEKCVLTQTVIFEAEVSKCFGAFDAQLLYFFAKRLLFVLQKEFVIFVQRFRMRGMQLKKDLKATAHSKIHVKSVSN